GEFVVSGGHGPVALEPVDAALDGVALFVDLSVEGGWPAALGSLGAAVGILVGLAWDGGLDAAPTQVGPVGLGRVRLVGQDPVRCGAGPTGTGPGYPDAVEYGDELRAVAALSGGQQHRQRLLALLAGQVQFGGQPAP